MVVSAQTVNLAMMLNMRTQERSRRRLSNLVNLRSKFKTKSKKLTEAMTKRSKSSRVTLMSKSNWPKQKPKRSRDNSLTLLTSASAVLTMAHYKKSSVELMMLCETLVQVVCLLKKRGKSVSERKLISQLFVKTSLTTMSRSLSM